MTTRTPIEIANELQRHVVNEYESRVYGPKFLSPFLEAGWESFSDLVLKKEIKSPFDDKLITFYAQYWASYDEPISIQFDQTGTQWFGTAQEAIEFTDKVISEFEGKITNAIG